MMTANYEYLAECDETLTAELKELQDQDILQGMMAEAAAVTSLPRSTLAEQFSSRIRNLEATIEGYNKESSSGGDVIKILKYFQKKLLEWAKDNSPGYNSQTKELITSTAQLWAKDNPPGYNSQTKEFNHLDCPTVDYISLYQTLLKSLKVSKKVTVDAEEFVDGVLKAIACLVPFLPARTLSAMPARLSSLLADLPPVTHSKAVDLVCLYLVPLVFGIILRDSDRKKSPVGLSAPSVLLSVLQSCSDRSLCFKVIESLMAFRENICSDLLSVLAYGSLEALEPAIHLLNRYFPAAGAGGVNIGVAEYRAAPKESTSSTTSTPYHVRCQSSFCPGKDVYSAVKVCLDPGLCSAALDKPPPMYLCKSCHESLEKESPDLFLDVVQFLSSISEHCENPYCQSEHKMAIYFCFSVECTRKNKNKPLRLCETCHLRLHSGECHMVHSSLHDLWTLENPTQTYLVDAIGRLLREAKPLHKERCIQMGMDPDIVDSLDIQNIKNTSYTEKIMRSFHGFWLLKVLCKIPPSKYIYEHASRLLSMLFSWVEAVSFTKHLKSYPQLIAIVEKCLDLAKAWMLQVVQYDFNLYCDCLLPLPPVQARVGLAWDALMSNMRQQLEGFQRLSALVSRNLVNDQVWERIMPYWMQELKSSVLADELSNFKVVLGRLFDARLETTPPYSLNFISKRLRNLYHGDRQEALVWLQILSAIDVVLDTENLLDMCIKSLKVGDVESDKSETPAFFQFPSAGVYQEIPKSPAPSTPTSGSPFIFPTLTSVDDNLTFCILLMDILVKQIVMQSQQMEKELSEQESTYLKELLKSMLEKNLLGEHSDHVTSRCNHCQKMSVFYYQITILVDCALPKEVDGGQRVDQGFSKSPASSRGSKSSVSSGSRSSSLKGSSSKESATKKTSQQSERSSKNSINKKVSGGSGVSFSDDPSFSGFVSSLVEPDEDEQTDDTDASMSARVSAGEAGNSEGSDAESLTEWKDRIRSSVSEKYVPKYKFQRSLSESAGWQGIFNTYPEVKLTISLLESFSTNHESRFEHAAELSSKEVLKQKDPTVLQHILTSLTMLCMRGECLRIAVREDLDLTYQLQTVFFIPSLWEKLESNSSQLAQLAVPLLLYCVCLPYGAERLCDEIELMFNNENWKKRFSAVEKVMLLCEFLSTECIRDSSLAKSTLVHGFAYLVLAVEDVHNAVSNRARTMLKSIRTSSLNCLYSYMEDQFRREPGDRMMLLHTFRSLNYVLEDTSPFSAHFFMKLFSYMMNQNIGLPDSHSSNLHSPTGSMMSFSDSESVFQGPHIPLWSRALSSPGRMTGLYTGGVLGQMPTRPRSNSAPLIRYQQMYTLRFGRSSSLNFTAGRIDHDYYDYEGPVLASDRKRRTWTPSIDPSSARKIEDQAFLGGQIGMGLDPVKEEDSGSERGSLKRSSVASTMSAISEQSVVFQDMDSEVLHCLVTMFLEFLGSNDKAKEDAFTKQIILLKNLLGELMGIKENGVLPKPEELRQSTVFRAYLFNITQVLDCNATVGKEFLKLTLQLLLNCVPDDGENWNEEGIKSTLAKLSPQLQHVWLMNLLIILYKLPFREHQEILQLIVIVINTLNSHAHDCSQRSGLKRGYTWKRDQSSKSSGKRKYRTITKAFFRSDNGKKESTSGPDNFELSPMSSVSTGSPVGQRKKEVMISTTGDQSSDIAETAFLKSDGSSIKDNESASMTTRILFCDKCELPLSQFGEEILNACIVVLSTFIHRDPELAAPVLMDMLSAVGRKAKPGAFPWESKGKTKPGGIPWQSYELTTVGATSGIAKQFLRCIFLQLNPNGLFVELFRSDIFDKDFFKSMVSALTDFYYYMEETVPIEKVLQDFSSRSNKQDRVRLLIRNMNYYLKFMSKEHMTPWDSLLPHFEGFFKNLPPALPTGVDLSVCFDIMSEMLGISKNFCKALLPSFGQILQHIIKKCDFKLDALRKVCHFCNKSFSKERDRVYLTRVVLSEMAVVLKCKSSAPEKNMKKLIQFVLLDGDSWLSFGIRDEVPRKRPVNKLQTQAMKCLTVYNNESLDFIRCWNYRLKDVKDKENEDESFRGNDFPILVKAGMAQAMAIQLKPDPHKPGGKVSGFIQIGPTDRTDQILEIVPNLRLLTWIILGTLNHMAESVAKRKELIHCIPLSESSRLAENVELVFSLTFRISENDKSRWRLIVPSMYFALMFSQAWTIYCERHILTRSLHPTEVHPLSIIMEFWARITSVIIRTLKESTQLEGEVIWIFANVIEGLAVYSKQAYARLSPLWFPLLELYKSRIKDVYLRLKKLETGVDDQKVDCMSRLCEWVSKTRLRLAHAEKAGSKLDPYFDA